MAAAVAIPAHMNATSTAPLLRHWRTHRQQLGDWAGAQPDPHAELLALVWGPTWDWAQARPLEAVLPGAALAQAAGEFERAAPATQQRLRQLIVRHRRWHAATRWENAAPCPASC